MQMGGVSCILRFLLYTAEKERYDRSGHKLSEQELVTYFWMMNSGNYNILALMVESIRHFVSAQKNDKHGIWI